MIALKCSDVSMCAGISGTPPWSSGCADGADGVDDSGGNGAAGVWQVGSCAPSLPSCAGGVFACLELHTSGRVHTFLVRSSNIGSASSSSTTQREPSAAAASSNVERWVATLSKALGPVLEARATYDIIKNKSNATTESNSSSFTTNAASVTATAAIKSSSHNGPSLPSFDEYFDSALSKLFTSPELATTIGTAVRGGGRKIWGCALF